MTSKYPTETAKIYQFPLRARGRAMQSTSPLAPSDLTVARAANSPVVTSGWYHEAAIQEDALARKQ